MNKKRETFLWNGIIVFLGILVVISFVISPYNVELDPDATYYMGVTRLLLDGKIPFVDFKIDYTPLVMYLMCLPVSIFGASYPVGMITSYLVQVYDAFIVYKIAGRIELSKRMSWFCSLYFLICCLFFGGRQYFLEPYVLAFGLSALFLLFRRSTLASFFAGIFCFAAFWSKQYGLGFLPLALLMAVIYQGSLRERLKKTIAVILGFLSFGCICIAQWTKSGVSRADIITFFQTDYVSAGLPGLLQSYKILLTFFPALVFILVILTLRPRILKQAPILIVCFCGILGFMLQGWFWYRYHYLMLVVPFAVFAIVCIYSILERGILKDIFLLSLILSIAIPTAVDIRKDIKILTSDIRDNREKCAAEIAKIVPVGSSNVFTSCSMLSLTLQNNYYPPLLKEFGMMNGFVVNPKDIYELLQSSSSCIIAAKDLSNTRLFTNEMKKYIYQNFRYREIVLNDEDSRCFVFSSLMTDYIHYSQKE